MPFRQSAAHCHFHHEVVPSENDSIGNLAANPGTLSRQVRFPLKTCGNDTILRRMKMKYQLIIVISVLATFPLWHAQAGVNGRTRLDTAGRAQKYLPEIIPSVKYPARNS